jgi:hypothetical protein
MLTHVECSHEQLLDFEGSQLARPVLPASPDKKSLGARWERRMKAVDYGSIDFA